MKWWKVKVPKGFIRHCNVYFEFLICHILDEKGGNQMKNDA
jgi:hypothetical protein